MRIAFQNPWRNAAENQAFQTLKIAAARIGYDLCHCVNSDDIEEMRPDFVLATASTQAKLTNVPTYGIIHEPRARFLGNQGYFRNLLSYDGHLTISDSLVTFLTNLMYGVGRAPDIGYYYNTCHENSVDPELAAKISESKAKLTYFGTNWDKRRTGLLRLLSTLDNVEIYGPEHSWRHIDPKTYKGTLPFDGVSVQNKYRENGIGLVLLSDAHLADDVISNRVFEITSVGAIAICCRIPWLERNFGDSVYYFDQQRSNLDAIEQITSILRDIKTNPTQAADRARRAERIFRDRFSAEKLLQNAVDYHVGRRTRYTPLCSSTANESRSRGPLISVIVRCGGRPIDSVRRALTNIADQTFGRFQVILVRYKPLEVGSLVDDFSTRFEEIVTVDCLGGNRSATLWCGLRHVNGEYFAMLDDDDGWMPNHFASLFESREISARTDFFAYTGYIKVCAELRQTEWEGLLERRFIEKFGIERCDQFLGQSQFLSSHSFVASSSLLDEALLVDPHMDTAEDSYLILSLLAKVAARFNYRATAIMYESNGGSSFDTHPQRANDLLTLRLRLLSHNARLPQVVDTGEFLSRVNKEIILPTASSSTEDLGDTLIYHVRDSVLFEDSREIVHPIPFMLDTQRLGIVKGSRLIDSAQVAMSITPPPKPWNYGVQFRLLFDPVPGALYLAEIDCTVTDGTLGFGVLNKAESGFIYEVPVPMSKKRILVQLPIENPEQIGRFVVRNWESGGVAHAEINSVTLLSNKSNSKRPHVVNSRDLLLREDVPKTPEIEERNDLIAYRVSGRLLSRDARESREPVSFFLAPGSLELAEGSQMIDSTRVAMSVTPPRGPWNDGAQFRLSFHPTPGARYLAELDCTVTDGTIVFGALNTTENDFSYAVSVPASKKRILVQLPIENATKSGRLAIRNTESGGAAHADVHGVTLWSYNSPTQRKRLWPPKLWPLKR